MELKTVIINIIEQKIQKVTPIELQKAVSEKREITPKAFKQAIRDLVGSGELIYTYQFGNSYLEKSFNRPVRIASRIVLVPEGFFFCPKSPDDIIVAIRPGISFGNGEHPTTRLAVKGIEKAIAKNWSMDPKPITKVLDIGTGSGILAMCALKLGITQAVGTDLDPCARKEAMENANLNGMGNRFKIFHGDLNQLNPGFDMITANLRYPTLMNISHEISRLADDTCSVIVLSGFSPHEFDPIIFEYNGKGFLCKWYEYEKNWGGAVFLRYQTPG
jgi:ribosomal protein L11 methyltransferase